MQNTKAKTAIPLKLMLIAITTLLYSPTILAESKVVTFLKKHIAPEHKLLRIDPECAPFSAEIDPITPAYSKIFTHNNEPIKSWSHTDLFYKTSTGKTWWVLTCNRSEADTSAISTLLQPNMFSETELHSFEHFRLFRLERKEGPIFEGKDLERDKISIRLHPVVVAGGLITDIQSHPEFPDILFASTHDGILKACSMTTNLCPDILRVPTHAVAELGFLGFAFHPNFKENRRVFLRYDVKGSGHIHRNRVSEITFPKDGYSPLDLTKERIIFETDQVGPYHSGGQINFGPDGMLYIGLGESERIGTRSLASLRGKLLRISVDQQTRKGDDQKAYGIPKNNPFTKTAGALPEIWAWGFRNPWRFAFDRKGRIWLGDVGENTIEELDIVESGGDYGWDVREGTTCFNNHTDCPKLKSDKAPIHEYRRDEGNAVIGGTFNTSQKKSALQGKYIFGDGVSGRLWAIDPDTTTAKRPAKIFSLGRWPIFISTFGRTAQGDVVVQAFTGPVYRVDAVTAAQ